MALCNLSLHPGCRKLIAARPGLLDRVWGLVQIHGPELAEMMCVDCHHLSGRCPSDFLPHCRNSNGTWVTLQPLLGLLDSDQEQVQLLALFGLVRLTTPAAAIEAELRVWIVKSTPRPAVSLPLTPRVCLCLAEYQGMLFRELAINGGLGALRRMVVMHPPQHAVTVLAKQLLTNLEFDLRKVSPQRCPLGLIAAQRWMVCR